MADNPKHAEGTSRRRKIISEFEINLGRCILCGICVDVCNFDAIEMSHEHELSKYERNGNRADLPKLLEMGQEFQTKTGWKPTQPEKNSGVPLKSDAAPAAQAAPAAPMSKEGRLAAARARAAAKRQGQEAGSAAPAAEMSKEERLAAARARAAAKRQGEEAGSTAPAAEMSKEERLAAARARAAAKRQGQEAGSAAPAAEMSKEERLAAARARAAAKRQGQETQEAESETP